MIYDHFPNFYSSAKDILKDHDKDFLHDLYRACFKDFSFQREYNKDDKLIKSFKDYKNDRVYLNINNKPTFELRAKDFKSGDMYIDFCMNDFCKIYLLKGNDIILITAYDDKQYCEAEILGETVDLTEKSFTYSVYKDAFSKFRDKALFINGKEEDFSIKKAQLFLNHFDLKTDLDIRVSCNELESSESLQQRKNYFVVLAELQKLNTLEVYQDGKLIENLNNLDINYADAFANSMKLCEKYYKEYTKKSNVFDSNNPTL